MRDLLKRSRVLRKQAARGDVAYGINVRHIWQATGKSKALDLAIGVPADNQAISPTGQISRVRRSTNAFAKLFIACEAKAVMTEHGKSQPRLFDELSSSHEIVHHGDQEAIAAGIVMVNIAPKFVSPLRQKDANQLHWSTHDQPTVAARMIQHLRGLRVRDEVGQVGFDAFCTFVVNCDNQTDCKLYKSIPAPQRGDADHYDTFIQRITQFYSERFEDFRR
jgi:hypothetical protein